MVDYRKLMDSDIILKDNQPSYVDIYNLFDLANGYNKENTKNWEYMDIDEEWLARNFEYNEDTDSYYEAYWDGTCVDVKKYICEEEYDERTNTIEKFYCYQVSIYYEDKEEPVYKFPEIFHVHALQHLFDLFLGGKTFKL